MMLNNRAGGYLIVANGRPTNTQSGHEDDAKRSWSTLKMNWTEKSNANKIRSLLATAIVQTVGHDIMVIWISNKKKLL